MKTHGDSGKQLIDRREVCGELFEAERDEPLAPQGQREATGQPPASSSADLGTRRVLDHVNHEALPASQNLEVAVPPAGALGQRPVRPNRAIGQYPRLEALLAQEGLPLKGIWTLRDVAGIFDVAVRTIQDWIYDGKLAARDLPGRGRFLSEDLEAFLQNSVKAVPRQDQRV